MKIKFKVKKKDVNINQEVKKRSKKVLYRAMLTMQNIAIQKAPVDTGTLRTRITISPIEQGFTQYQLIANTDYAAGVEYGTDPHKISAEGFENLVRWSRRKLGNKNAAWGVKYKIENTGTEAQPYMRPARDEVMNVHIDRIVEVVFSG